MAALASGSSSKATSGKARAERNAMAVISMASAKCSGRLPSRASVPPATPTSSVAMIGQEPAAWKSKL